MQDELKNLMAALKPAYDKELQFDLFRCMAIFAFKQATIGEPQQRRDFIKFWRKRVEDAFIKDFELGEYKFLNKDEEFGALQDEIGDLVAEFQRTMNAGENY